jgi:hypothetical protein
MRKAIGYITFVAGVVDELLIVLEQTHILHEILPSWITTQKMAISLLAVGLVAILATHRSIFKGDSTPTPTPAPVPPTAVNQIASATTLEVIRFDYLPASPIDSGWAKAYKPDGIAAFGSDPDIQGSLRMRVTQSEFAMDHIVPVHATLANRLVFTAKYNNSPDPALATMVFAFVEVSTRNGQERKRTWFKFYYGEKGAFQTPGNVWHDPQKQLPEQTVYWPAVVLQKGQLKFDIDLHEAVSLALGAQGWVYKGIYKIRLRGNLSMSPIEFADGKP